MSCRGPKLSAQRPSLPLPAVAHFLTPRVPHLANLKKACFNQINAYRTCLEENSTRPDAEVQARCSPALKELWECTDANAPGLAQAASAAKADERI